MYKSAVRGCNAAAIDTSGTILENSESVAGAPQDNRIKKDKHCAMPGRFIAPAPFACVADLQDKSSL
jgi:hypothetical protein